MAKIANDQDFKQALESLSPADQRVVASRFAENVLDLIDDFRVKRAVEIAASSSLAEGELESAYKGVKSVVVETYTSCGHDAEWLAQAGHFVAAAAAAAVVPASQVSEVGNPAWKAAMHARMARTCEMIASGEGGTHTEAERQYEIVETYLAA